MGSELELPQLELIIARDGRGISVGALSGGSNLSQHIEVAPHNLHSIHGDGGRSLKRTVP